MTKIKRLFTILLICSIIVPTTVNASDSNLDKVKEFLDNYGSDENTFYVEEYPFSKDTKQLFVRISATKDDLNINGLNIIDNKSKYFMEMTKQDWFDYEMITCIMFSRDGVSGSYNEYYVNTGIKVNSWGEAYPWIVNTEDDLSQETILFLGRVAQELISCNIDASISLEIGIGGEENLSIQECAGVAVVKGQYEFNQKTYNYITEFSYESESERTGTYDTLYIGVNDVDIYGEYKNIEDIKIQKYSH